METVEISWYIISTGYEDRLNYNYDKNEYMEYEEKCQLIKEIDFPPGAYIIFGNLNYQGLKVDINYLSNDTKHYNFDIIDISDLHYAITEYINNYYEETGLVLSTGIPSNIPYCATFGIADTTLYKTNSGHYFLKLLYDSESG